MMDSVNKYGSDGVPFTGKVAEIIPLEQQIQGISNAFQFVADAFAEITHEFNRLWEAVMKSYPDKRIVHLAFHGKTARIRKKNRKRISKQIVKAAKRNG